MDVYQVINSRIMELLEQGHLPPWKRSWNAQSNYPKNLASGKRYNGINVFILACQQYSSPWFLTYNQCSALGGRILKGSKSSPVIFWKWLDSKDTDSGDGPRSGKIPLLRYYSVFNSDQTEGITLPEPEETHNQFDPITRAEEIVTGMPLLPEIKYSGNRAYYSPTLDYIQLPHLHTFDSAEEAACCKFHEIVHASGHSSRLARKSILEPSYYGSHEYSKEELVAEMGAAFLCGFCNIEQKTIDNSAAYISGWLRSLKNDKTLLVQAASAAQKAADYILNITHPTDQPELT